ncbi:MAG: bifunctional ornithine acetyltransferase/N-acetylglutamate synthase, partial [Atopobiaceae bacterium]|nr:bifunctional ornithine acetyltransferase/N-acetylglutamate synthase [Atopobiaceae bacterium]
AIRCACENLARKIAADGEGATKLVTVDVIGAATDEDADTVARAIANSPLVKTAIFGHDANWGRIAGAAGKCGVMFEQTDVDIDFMGVPVCRAGLTVPMDEEDMLRRYDEPEVTIAVNLGSGDASARIWTCDLTHDYVTINGDYRT